MLEITPDELTAYAKSLQGSQLYTITEAKPFTVEVQAGTLHYTNSKDKTRDHGGKYLHAVCDRFNKTKSLKVGDYRQDTVNASYTLALLVLYLASIVSGQTK